MTDLLVVLAVVPWSLLAAATYALHRRWKQREALLRKLEETEAQARRENQALAARAALAPASFPAALDAAVKNAPSLFEEHRRRLALVRQRETEADGSE